MRRTNADQDTATHEVPLGKGPGFYWLEVGDQDSHKAIAVADGVRLTVGSDRSCDVVLSDRTVSGCHCELACENGVLWVRDLGSKNGVYAGGARVEQAQLRTGSCFAVGRVGMSVRPAWETEGDEKPLPGVVGTSIEMLRVASHVRRVAKLSVPVLIRGATGTGKEVIARAMHEASPRRHKPFVPINIGTVPSPLAAAELFGHDRGAFTGAGKGRRGAFAAADSGSLFLDEIGEANHDVQVHLLRVLEQGEVQPLGSDKRLRVDVRVIAATWVSLEQAVGEGKFREDLFHRLAVGTITLPTLSERRTDIGLLAAHVLDKHRAEFGPKQLSPSAVGRLMAYDWPGNVRELNNVVLRAALSTGGEWIHAQDIDSALRGRARAGRMSPAAARALVRTCQGAVSAAARMCGVPRSTFRGWLAGREQRDGSERTAYGETAEVRSHQRRDHR